MLFCSWFLTEFWWIILHGWLLHGCVTWAEDCYDWWLPCLALWLKHWYQKPWAWSPDFYCIHISLSYYTIKIFFIKAYLFRIEFSSVCSFHKLLHVWFLFFINIKWVKCNCFGRNCNVLTTTFWSGNMHGSRTSLLRTKYCEQGAALQM